MENVKALQGQTQIDIAVQKLGDAERAFEIAVMNGIAITDDLTAGSTLMVPDYDISKRNIVQLFTDSSNAPSSDEDDEAILSKQEGIGYWKIGVDFKVS